MRLLLRIAVALYPPAWRARYGTEFAALLEDVRPGWRELLDIVWQALAARAATSGFRIAAGLALAGLIAGAVVAMRMPRMYSAEAVLEMPATVDVAVTDPVPRMVRGLHEEVLSRSSLAEVIRRFDLYPEERRQMPLENVIERMRKAISITLVGEGGRPDGKAVGCRLRFSYPDPVLAGSTTTELLHRTAEAHRRWVSMPWFGPENSLWNAVPRVFEGSTAPATRDDPRTAALLSFGLLSGLGMGVLVSVSRRWPLAVSGVAACSLIAWALGEFPARSSSHARVVIRVAGDVGSRLENARQRMGRIRSASSNQAIRIERSRFDGTELVRIHSSAPSAKEAQAVVRAMLTSLVAEFLPETGRDPGAFEILDPASLPTAPDGVDWRIPVAAGLGFGLPIGIFAERIRRRRTLRSAEALS
jgi:hypothetical protein